MIYKNIFFLNIIMKKIIENHDILKRWSLLNNYWEKDFKELDAILIRDGIEDDEIIKIKTLAIQTWFYRYEFVNSIIIITKDSLIIFSDQEKIDLFKDMGKILKKKNKKLYLVEKKNKLNKNDLKKLFTIIKEKKLQKFGYFKKEEQRGKLITLFDEKLKEIENFQEFDVGKKIQEILSVKDKTDIEIIKKASKASNYYFDKYINKVEDVIDKDTKISHNEISKIMEEKFLDSKELLIKKFQINPLFVDFSYSPIIQSGNRFILRPNIESNDSDLSYDVILMNMAVKYFELNCNIFRTLLINPTEQIKNNYESMLWLHKKIIDNLKEGKVISDIYVKCKNEFIEKFPDLIKKLPKNFGYGIGYEFKESYLLISEKNNVKIKRGNVFTVITSLKNLTNENNYIHSMHISDTILIDTDGKSINLTEETGSSYESIGYDISETKNPKIESIELNKKEEGNLVYRSSKRAIKRQRMMNSQSKVSKIRENQERLMQNLMDNLKERIRTGEFLNNSPLSNKIVLQKLETYSKNNFPKKLAKKNIHVDPEKFAVLLPIYGNLVPFHVSCIKNVTKNQEHKYISLRFNFQTPSISTGDIIFPFSKTFGSHPIYIKELNYRTTNIEGILAITKQIKEMQKKYKLNLTITTKPALEPPADDLKDLITNLVDLKMRPTLTGRKTHGNLTSYKNGFKFISKRNKTFILLLTNIKRAIFQPCDDNMIVIIHFLLKRPMIINKKITNHIQFFAEVGYTSEDLNDPRKKNRLQKTDEEENEEILERNAKDHYNVLFLKFVKKVEENWDSDLTFDLPYKEFKFLGSPFYNNVYIMPSAHCLVSLIELPFLVIELSDIELVSIERVDSKIKTFDIVVIFKDYSKQVQSINNIPKSNLGNIKEWLNNEDILFIEVGSVNLKWDKFLKKIREDPEKFVFEENGWFAFFNYNTNDDNEDFDCDSDFNEEDVVKENVEDQIDEKDFFEDSAESSNKSEQEEEEWEFDKLSISDDNYSLNKTYKREKKMFKIK